jgi:hypothetical protein
MHPDADKLKRKMEKTFNFLVAGVIFLLLALAGYPSLACSKAEPETINIREILAQAASVTEVKYEFKMTAQGSSAGTFKIWMKGSKWRIEMPPSQDIPTPTTPGSWVSITAGYFVDTEAETCFSWDQNGEVGESSYPYACLDVLDYVSEIGLAKFIAESNPELIGTETIDGKSSLLIEFTYEPESGQGTINGKAWIWKEKPFILRFEAMISGVNGTLIMEFKNIDFGDIPDSIFEEPQVFIRDNIIPSVTPPESI